MKLVSTYIASIMLSLYFLAGCNQKDKKYIESTDNEARRLEILFVGHSSKHHNSGAYLPLLSSALAKNGINITYTEKVEELNTKNLALYDGVILYANHEGNHPAEVKALMKYVEDGHAFIPIHCASFCFKDSPDYIDLVGGQFNEHGTGIFTVDIVNTEHEAVAGLEEFSTWDETYVHHKLAKDITVLMERKEGDHSEPWTWIKEYGKGKVFYTAYGHDGRTWSHPGFQELIKKGIVWAVDDKARELWVEYSKDIPVLVYENRDNIPNYEKREPAPKYQLPLSPKESAKLIQVPPGFKLELFASEPDIINPIAMNWDEKGRLWVIETVDYPNTVREAIGVGDDRIKICEDTDGDGRADKFSIFAEGLNIPTSFAFWKDGIVVSQAPNFLYLEDSNGDDKADIKELLIAGWGTFDTHAGPSNLQRGLDNDLYGVVGYSGFKGSIFGLENEFKQGVYRLNPEKESFTFLTNTSNNTWGLGITEDNSIFASTANNTHSVFVGIPNSYFEGVEGLPGKGNAKIDGHYNMQPITRNIRQVDVFDGFTAASGHHFYISREYPANYWNRIAFVCEPTGGLVHKAIIEQEGAGYREVDGGNLFASSDEWVSPVEAKVGPDGAVWVLDWYNFIVQHNPTPRKERGGYDAENGKGNAYINPLRDRSHGRIWRVVYQKADELESPILSGDDPEGLVKALSHPNMFWRLTAQRLLVDGENLDILPSLYQLVNNSRVNAKEGYHAALHALWTIDGLGLIPSDAEATAVVKGALFHPTAAVRKAAIQMLPRTQWVDEAMLLANVLWDRDPKVQLAVLAYIADRENSVKIGELLYELSQDRNTMADNWLSTAVYIAASRHADGFIRAYLAENPNPKLISPLRQEMDEAEIRDNNMAEMFVRNYIDKMGQLPDVTEDSASSVTTILIKTIQNEMKYDLTEFVVDAGKPVEVVFENNDFMQHNLVIVAPGGKEKVGLAADQLAMDPAGADMNYVPELDEVLYATAIIDPQGKAVLRFNAPSQPGIYPYICTFPGHWRIMQGVMKVIAP